MKVMATVFIRRATMTSMWSPISGGVTVPSVKTREELTSPLASMKRQVCGAGKGVEEINENDSGAGTRRL